MAWHGRDMAWHGRGIVWHGLVEQMHDIFGFRIFLRGICFKFHSILTSSNKDIQENVA